MHFGPRDAIPRAGVSRGTLSVRPSSGRGSPDEKPTHLDVGHIRYCICMARSVIISPFTRHVVRTKIGPKYPKSGVDPAEKKRKGTIEPGTVVLEPWSCRRSPIFSSKVSFLRVNQLTGSRCGFGPVTQHPESPERSKIPVHFFSPSLLRSAVSCRSVSCLGSQIGSSELRRQNNLQKGEG